MKDADRKEMLQLVEAEYDRTTKFIEGTVGTTTSIRGWAITVWAALLGAAFSTKLPVLAYLGFLAVVAFALVDTYYSSLYVQTLTRARELERITNEHFDALARGEDNPRLRPAADAALAAHSYGLYTNMRVVAWKKPQMFFWIYMALALIAIVAGVATVFIPAATTQVGGTLPPSPQPSPSR